MKNAIIPIFTILLLASCKNNKEVAEAGSKTPDSFEQVVDTDSLLIAYQRSVCFGKCPQDEIIIYKSGYMVYEGKKDVDIVGKATNNLKAEDLQALKDIINNTNPSEYPEEFGMSVSDLPTKTFTFNLGGGKRKTVAFKSNDKEALKKLMQSLNSTIDQYFMY